MPDDIHPRPVMKRKLDPTWVPLVVLAALIVTGTWFLLEACARPIGLGPTMIVTCHFRARQVGSGGAFAQAGRFGPARLAGLRPNAQDFPLTDNPSPSCD